MCYWSRNRRFFLAFGTIPSASYSSMWPAHDHFLRKKPFVWSFVWLRKLRLLQWLCFTCLWILGIEKPKNSCCCCSELIIDEIMELGFDFTNELGVKVAMKTDIHPSSPTVAGECFVLQRRSCGCCSKRKAASMLFSLFLFCCCFFALFFCLYFLSKNN